MSRKIILSLLIILPFLLFSQKHESIYALNSGVTTNQVVQGESIQFNETKPFPNSSYIKIKEKVDNSFYIQTTINGKLAYGHYFKFKSEINGVFKYVRTDGDEIEYVITNYPLNELALSIKYDEKVELKLINYRTSFAMLIQF